MSSLISREIAKKNKSVHIRKERKKTGENNDKEMRTRARFFNHRKLQICENV